MKQMFGQLDVLREYIGIMDDDFSQNDLPFVQFVWLFLQYDAQDKIWTKFSMSLFTDMLC